MFSSLVYFWLWEQIVLSFDNLLNNNEICITDSVLLKFVEAGIRLFNLLKLGDRCLLMVNNSLENVVKIINRIKTTSRKHYFLRRFRF